MKLHKNGEEGFMALALLLAIGAIALTAGYVTTQNRNVKHNASRIEGDIARHTSELSNLSHLGRFRSLVATRKMPAGDYEAPLYPINYFASKWQWEKSARIPLPSIELNGSQVRFSSIGSGTLKLANAQAMLSGSKSSMSLLQQPQDIEIIAQNADPDHPYYISSIDVTTRRPLDIKDGDAKREVQTSGRITMEAPLPSNLRILVRAPGSAAFQELKEKDVLSGGGGLYQFQLRASGVVHYAELDLDGQVFRLGVDPVDGHITHQANNILAKDILIGEISRNLGGAKSGDLDNATVNFDECRVGVEPSDGAGAGGTAGDISVKVSAIMYSVKGEAQINKGGFLDVEGAGGVNPPAPAGCEQMCPVSFQEFWKDPIQQAAYLDLAAIGSSDTRKLDYFEPELSGLIEASTRGVICSNMELVAQAIVQEAGRRPTQILLNDQSRYEDLRNKNLPLKRFFAYTAPSCRRQLIGQRTACGCFAEDTQITMGDGSFKPVSEIREGDFVWNPKKERAQLVTRVIAGPEMRAMYRIATAAKTVTVTHQHPFLTRDGLKAASEILVGEEFEDGQKVIAIDLIEAALGNAPTVWNFELLGSHDADDHMVLANGIPTADLYIQETLQKAPKALAR